MLHHSGGLRILPRDYIQSIDFAEGKSLELNGTDSFATFKKENSGSVSILPNTKIIIFKKLKVQMIN